MQDVAFALQHQVHDERSRERSYTLRVENRGTERLHVQGIVPRIPKKVDLVEAQDMASIGAQKRRQELTGELTQLVTTQILQRSGDVIAKAGDAYRQTVKEVIGNPFFLFLSGQLRELADIRVSAVLQSLLVTVEDADDAAQAREAFLGEGADDIILKVYDLKVEQLKRTERNLTTDNPDDSTTIEPGSFFSMAYSMRFPRELMNSRQYSVTFDITYSFRETGPEGTVSEGRGTLPRRGTVSESVIIGGSPVALSGIAMVGGLLGVVLKVAFLRGDAVDALTVTALGNALVSGPSIAAAVLALIVFQMYENIDAFKRLTLGVGWRSALVVGALTGLFSDRIMAALSAIVGGS